MFLGLTTTDSQRECGRDRSFVPTAFVAIGLFAGLKSTPEPVGAGVTDCPQQTRSAVLEFVAMIRSEYGKAAAEGPY